jgi:hypothetical protein
MKRTTAIVASLVVAGAASGCTSRDVASTPDQFATETDVREHSCDVVAVDHEVSPLEEGLGSLYDIDEQGYSQADEDSEALSIADKEIYLGHHAFTTEDGDRIDAHAKDRWEEFALAPKGSQERYTVRVFEPSGLGVVLYKKRTSAAAKRMATLDCRGVLDVEPEDADVANMSQCTVVWVDQDLNASVLEEGLASIYDVDDEGLPSADGDAAHVWIDADALDITLGHHAFNQADGDAIEIEDTDDALTYVVRPQANSEVFSLRIFRRANDAEIPGIGVILHQAEASSAPKQLAVVDCRGVEAPEEY